MLEKLKELLSGYVDNVENITESSRLVADVGLSSLDVITFLGDVEDEFSLPGIKEDELPKLVTVGDVMNYIQANQK